LTIRAIGAGRLHISWSADRLRTHKPDQVLIATASVTFDHTGTTPANLKLTRAGKRLLRHSIQLDVTGTQRFTPIGRQPVMVVKRFALR
jgi:hypothetical protein